MFCWQRTSAFAALAALFVVTVPTALRTQEATPAALPAVWQVENLLMPGQVVTVRFGRLPQLDDVYRIGQDGMIALETPTGWAFVRIGGLHPEEAAARIAQQLSLRGRSLPVIVLPGVHLRPIRSSRLATIQARNDSLIPNPADPIENGTARLGKDADEEEHGSAPGIPPDWIDWVLIDVWYDWCSTIPPNPWPAPSPSCPPAYCSDYDPCSGYYRYIPNSAESPGSPSRLEGPYVRPRN